MTNRFSINFDPCLHLEPSPIHQFYQVTHLVTRPSLFCPIIHQLISTQPPIHFCPFNHLATLLTAPPPNNLPREDVRLHNIRVEEMAIFFFNSY